LRAAEIEMAAVIKKDAHELIDRLPDSATWDDVIYQAYVRREIEAGLADSAAGRVMPAEALLRLLDGE
jgi:hypothetical protein